MSLVEKNLTELNIERSRNNPEFQKRRERERKFTLSSPMELDGFKARAVPIEQVYLSHPSEEFSLRVRAKYTADGPRYTATLKDNGEVIDGALDRLEVETPINQAVYEYYANNPDLPRVKKLRAEPLPGLSVDFVEGLVSPIVEIEEIDGFDDIWTDASMIGLVDRTDDPSLHNESIAHQLHGKETLVPNTETTEALVKRIMKDMVATYTLGGQQVVAGLSGMSGSGKTTVVHELESALVETLGEEFRPIILSSDDYHRGKKWLEETYGAPWTNWDDPRVYNTEELASDLKSLANGESIARKHFDFATEEVIYDSIMKPSPFVILEGLFAGSPDLKNVRNLHYDMPTGAATSVGRDIRRLVLENRTNGSIGSPESRLAYQLETALPTYLSQERPNRNQFSAHSRPLAERAFLLTKLKD